MSGKTFFLLPSVNVTIILAPLRLFARPVHSFAQADREQSAAQAIARRKGKVVLYLQHETD